MIQRRTPLKRSGQLKRTKLSPVSAKRRKESALYAKKRKAFLELHPWCEVEMTRFRGVRSCDIHHKVGRTGKNYLDESTWMAVSREGHRWIHDHPKEARARGWLK